MCIYVYTYIHMYVANYGDLSIDNLSTNTISAPYHISFIAMHFQGARAMDPIRSIC